jgi:hypothetical protein
MKKIVVLGLLYVVIGITFIAINCSKQSSDSSISINVNDPREKVSANINDKLLLQISRINNVDIDNRDWEVSVLEKPVQPNSENLLYHSDKWHGPYPTDVYAWSFKEKRFPDNRLLSVRGYNYNVQIELIDCSTIGSGAQIKFKDGTVKVTWTQK